MLFVCYFLDELRFSRIFSYLGDMRVDFRFKSDAPNRIVSLCKSQWLSQVLQYSIVFFLFCFFKLLRTLHDRQRPQATRHVEEGGE